MVFWENKTSELVTLSISEPRKETYNVVLTFESVNEILYCAHSNETFLVVLSRDIFFPQCFTKRNMGFFLNFDFLLTWELKVDVLLIGFIDFFPFIERLKRASVLVVRC